MPTQGSTPDQLREALRIEGILKALIPVIVTAVCTPGDNVKVRHVGYKRFDLADESLNSLVEGKEQMAS